jgi:hypothetical protein
MSGTTLVMSLAYYPQTYGQTEIVKKCLKGYLGCYYLDKQSQWMKWLPLEKWWHNTTYHSFTKMFRFEALYGYPTPSISYVLKVQST